MTNKKRVMISSILSLAIGIIYIIVLFGPSWIQNSETSIRLLLILSSAVALSQFVFLLYIRRYWKLIPFMGFIVAILLVLQYYVAVWLFG